MLVIPPAEAYGEDPEAHELGGETLIFVVDVLDAAHTAD
jgi:peptidylprolyl isomerase